MNVTRRDTLRLAAFSALLAGTAGAAAACSSSSSTAAPGNTTGPITLNLWTWTGAPGTAQVNALIKGYQALHPNVTVKNNETASDTFKTKAALALNSGTEIDVLAVQPNLFAAQVQSHLRPLSSWQNYLPAGTVDKFTDLSMAQLKKLFTGGETYALPWGGSGSAVGFYNASMLQDLGVTAPTSWDEMASLAATLKSKKPGVSVAVMPAGSTDGWFLDEFVLTLVGQSDPTFFNDVRYDNAKWDTSSYVAALTQLKQLYATGALDPNVLDLGYSDAEKLFYSGKSAILFNGTWESTDLSAAYRSANGIDIGDVGVMGVPTSDGSAPSLRSFLDVTLGIPKSAKNPAVAADFIAYATAGAGVDLWANTLGELPLIKGWTAPAGDLTSPAATQGLALLQQLIANPHSDRNNLSAFSSQVGVRIEAMLEGSTTPSQAATLMQSDLDSGKYS